MKEENFKKNIILHGHVNGYACASVDSSGKPTKVHEEHM